MCKAKSIILLMMFAVVLCAEVNIIEINSKIPLGYIPEHSGLNPLRSRYTLENVPSYKWSYGCSPTAGAMMIAYYDHYENDHGMGYINLYAGNLPSTNAVYGTTVWTDFINGGNITVNECPLSASHLGIGGQTTRGHVDDFWLGFGSTDTDPYITNNWQLHGFNCVADFCGTSQNGTGNSPYDGATLVGFNTDGTPYYGHSTAIEFSYGLKAYCENKGYAVESAYNQYTESAGLSDWFSFADLEAEIDNGHPVAIHFVNSTGGHTVLAYGYEDATEEVYIKTTWDYSYDIFEWNSPYIVNSIQYNLLGVTVLNLEDLSFATTTNYIETQYESNNIQIAVETSGITDLGWTASITDGDEWMSFVSNNHGAGDGGVAVHINENITTSDRLGELTFTPDQTHPHIEPFVVYIYQYMYQEGIIVVSSNGSIQSAIDYVQPGEDIMIMVEPGVYTEMIEIDNYLGSRNITLRSMEGPLETIIEMDPAGSDAVVSVIGCGTDQIKIEGFTIRNGQGGTVSPDGDDTLRGGGGLLIFSSTVELKNSILTENKVQDFGGAIYVRDSDLDLINVTIFDNEIIDLVEGAGGGIFTNLGSTITILNTIMYDNTPDDIASFNSTGQTIDIEYSMINEIDLQMTGLTMNHCIEGDPVICNFSDNDINLNGCIMETSPCIDSGDSSILDSDGTISDMGAVSTCTDIKECQGNHWNWVSFPRIGNMVSDISDNISDVLDMDDLYPIYGFDPMMHISSFEYPECSFYCEGWQPEVNIYSAVGYKVYRYDDSNFYIPLEGYRLSNTYQFSINANLDKWLGYWIPETRNIEDAFNGLWDYVNTIEAEDWFYRKPVNGFYTPSSSTEGKNLEYGKMYILNIDATTTWTWDPPGGGGVNSSSERSKPKFFVFADQPDYLAVDILDIDDNIEEIGIFQGNTCIGASVVDSSSVQVLAYIDPNLRDSPELSLQYYEQGRAGAIVKECWVYDETNDEFKIEKPKINAQGYLLLSLKTEYPQNDCPVPGSHLYQNHPNPFNPETTIEFYLAEEASDPSLEIYNVKGQIVKSFKLCGYSGNCSITWDGRSNTGSFVSSGIYFYKLESNLGSISRKMIMMK